MGEINLFVFINLVHLYIIGKNAKKTWPDQDASETLLVAINSAKLCNTNQQPTQTTNQPHYNPLFRVEKAPKLIASAHLKHHKFVYVGGRSTRVPSLPK
jgi:hypothetical protein